MPFDPLKLARETGKVVSKGELRKYYRFRPAKFYGGIATADCCGCCLRCIYCWSRAPLRHPERVGRFYNPKQVFDKLNTIAQKHGYQSLRISGNEPTIGKQHLLHLLKLIQQTDYRFILETNGILLGSDPSYAREVAGFDNVHVRVSLKGCDAEQFSELTGAKPEAFELQLEALRNLLNFGGSCHAAVMEEFAPRERFGGLKQRLAAIDPSLVRELEFEHLIYYKHVVERLKRSGLL
ncbi:MAG: radical SAM protein [Candidatus Hadarchaeota archaeon]|nr:radical SAM protein [Candidatus Hadarchaeota archaeon]